MTKILHLTIALSFLLLIEGCNKNETIYLEDERPFLRILPEDQNSGEIILNAEVLYFGENLGISHGFIWGTDSTSLLNSVDLGSILVPGKFSYSLTNGIRRGTTYYVRAYVNEYYSEKLVIDY